MLQLLYQLFLFLYYAVVRLAALLGHPKAKAWIEGRQDWLANLDRFRSQRSEVPLIWMHCASLGEFEQGRPILEHLRREHPDHLLAVTFYSPSGYEKRKDYEGADWVGYLPLDTPRNARLWIATLRPSLAIFVKYEFWHFHLAALKKQAVPVALIAGSFRPGQPFFRPYGAFFRRMLSSFTLLAVQTEKDRDLLDNLHLPGRIIVTGDPRADRTLAIVQEPFSDPLIEAFAAGHHVLIAGSTWPADEQLLHALLPQWPSGWKLLIAPHEISAGHLENLERLFADNSVRYTAAPDAQRLAGARVLLLDTVGLLNKVYRYGRIAYIGGGFGAGIHNTLEPMAYGLPILFGPRYQKFPEAERAVRSGAGVSVCDEATLVTGFTALQDEEKYAAARANVRVLMKASSGAAARTNAALDQLLR